MIDKYVACLLKFTIQYRPFILFYLHPKWDTLSWKFIYFIKANRNGEEKPMMRGDAPAGTGRQDTGYEKSRKEYV